MRSNEFICLLALQVWGCCGTGTHRPSQPFSTEDGCDSEATDDKRGVFEALDTERTGQRGYSQIVNRGAADPHYVTTDLRAPCSRDESPICARLDAEDLADTSIVVYFFYTSNFRQPNEKLESSIRAFYVASPEDEAKLMSESDSYRPKRTAITGQYLGATPVGLWQLWAPNGDLIGYVSFNKSSDYVACPTK